MYYESISINLMWVDNKKIPYFSTYDFAYKQLAQRVKIISLYGRGLSTREINKQIQDLYGIEVSSTMGK